MARISDVPQPIDPRDPKRVESRRDADTSETKSSGASGATGADRVAISSDARESEALRDRLTQAAAAMVSQANSTNDVALMLLR